LAIEKRIAESIPAPNPILEIWRIQIYWLVLKQLRSVLLQRGQPSALDLIPCAIYSWAVLSDLKHIYGAPVVCLCYYVEVLCFYHVLLFQGHSNKSSFSVAEFLWPVIVSKLLHWWMYCCDVLDLVPVS